MSQVVEQDLLLNISIQILRVDIDALEAVAALVSNLKASYVRVTMNRPSDITGFQRAGWQTTHPTWDTFMVKPLLPELTVDEAQRLFGIGTDRFLISWLDTTCCF
jgi:hypothetical protein